MCIHSYIQVVPDKSWTKEPNRFSKKFKDGVQSFLLYSIQYADWKDNKIWCPCRFHNNNERQEFRSVWKDLHERGFSYSYSDEAWVFHGEPPKNKDDDHSDLDNSVLEDDQDADTYVDMNGGLDELMDDVDAMH